MKKIFFILAAVHIAVVSYLSEAAIIPDKEDLKTTFSNLADSLSVPGMHVQRLVQVASTPVQMSFAGRYEIKQENKR